MTSGGEESDAGGHLMEECSHCRREVWNPIDRFCTRCGRRLREESSLVRGIFPGLKSPAVRRGLFLCTGVVVVSGGLWLTYRSPTSQSAHDTPVPTIASKNPTPVEVQEGTSIDVTSREQSGAAVGPAGEGDGGSSTPDPTKEEQDQNHTVTDASASASENPQPAAQARRAEQARHAAEIERERLEKEARARAAERRKVEEQRLAEERRRAAERKRKLREEEEKRQALKRADEEQAVRAAAAAQQSTDSFVPVPPTFQLVSNWAPLYERPDVTSRQVGLIRPMTRVQIVARNSRMARVRSMRSAAMAYMLLEHLQKAEAPDRAAECRRNPYAAGCEGSN